MHRQVKKILIFGNSGSGKSTLANKLSESESLTHLDLDTLAWHPTSPPSRMPILESAKAIAKFTETYKGWVIEGCYADLLELALPASNENHIYEPAHRDLHQKRKEQAP